MICFLYTYLRGEVCIINQLSLPSRCLKILQVPVCVCACVHVRECTDCFIKVIDELFSGESLQKHSKSSMCYMA